MTHLSVVERDGRQVSTATAWWRDHHRLVARPVALFCIHNVRLDRDCEACKPPNRKER